MSDDVKPREFYLPHKPITYDEQTRLPRALPFFYTNAISSLAVVFAIYRPLQFQVAYSTNSDYLPATDSCFKVVYEKVGQTNCEGVSKYELTEQSRTDLLSEQRKILAEIDEV